MTKSNMNLSLNMYKNKPMAHHEIDLLTKFHFAILQEASPINHQGHDKTPADETI